MELGVQAADPMMAVDGQFNVRIARTAVAEGMKVESQSKQGLDFYKLADKASGMISVGFYYKNSIFYKSRKAWDKAREMMRSAPGNLGQVGRLETKPHFEEVNLTPELLVVGGGLAGMEAALVGAEAGVRVALVEAGPWLGGFHSFQGEKDLSLIVPLRQKLSGFGNLTVMTATTASMFYPDGLVVCVQSGSPDEPFAERTYLIRPKAVVFATGAMDRPLMFSNNDRPGVMLPQTAQRLIHLYALTPADRVILSGGDDYLYKVALDLVEHGVKVVGLADCRSSSGVATNLQPALEKLGVPVWTGSTVIEAKGKKNVTGAVVAKVGEKSGRELKCDGIIAASGRSPLLKLVAQAEAAIVYNPELGFHQASNLSRHFAAAGRMNGLQDPEAIRAEGRFAAASVLSTLGLKLTEVSQEAAEVLKRAPAIRPNPPQMRAVGENDRRFVCTGNDVTEKDIDQALAEGFSHLEMIKRYTTATMGAEQGALSQANFLDYLAFKVPEKMGAQKIYTPRPPLVGVSLGAMAAGHHDEAKVTPLHQVQISRGGQLVRTGLWSRVEHFGDAEGESLAVHQSAALVDVSTLGKFRIFGPDAEAWLNLINTKSVSGLKANRIRYMAACNEEGVVIDDGVAIKIAENDYYFTTSTARSAAVMSWYHRFKKPEWKAWLVNLTEAKAGMNLVGPKAREILSKLTTADVSNSALPFMGWVAADVAGAPIYIFRMGFLGELSYEIHCPASQGAYLWKHILEKGERYGLKQAGLETQLICRLEKGHILPGLDADGNTTMFESHFDWLWDESKGDCIGAPILRLLKNQPHKKQIIGFSLDGRSGLIDGNLVVKGMKRMGYITSVRYSPHLKQTIGLALVEPHEDFKAGARVALWLNGKEVEANCIKPPFFDPKGERMKI
jgi:sarcosine oxidase subunit alpha